MPPPQPSHWSLTARRGSAGGSSAGAPGAPGARVALAPGAASFPPPARALRYPGPRRAAGRPREWARRRRQGSRMWWRAGDAAAPFSGRTPGPAGACGFHAALPAGRGRVLPPVGSQCRLEQGNYRSAPAFPLHKRRTVKLSRTIESGLTELARRIRCRV